ncbi:hypothetical protein J2Y02_002300 [Neobacillus drentensis]|nr:hypothetical protein [Neobacillus drentensis]
MTVEVEKMVQRYLVETTNARGGRKSGPTATSGSD